MTLQQQSITHNQRQESPETSSLPEPRSASSPLLSVVGAGIIGSFAAWHICLVGMVETFAERNLIGESVTLGYVMLVALVFLVGSMVAGRARHPGVAVGYGVVSGCIVGLSLLLLVYLIQNTDINDIFPFASSNLVSLLIAERGGQEESESARTWIPILAGSISGAIGAGMARLPRLWRRTMTVSLLLVLLLALLRDVVAVLLPDDIQKFFFTSSGLTPTGAVTTGVVFAGIIVARSWYQPRATQKQGRGQAARPTRSWQWWVGMSTLAIFLLSFPLWSKAFLSNVAVLVGLYIIMGMGLNLVIGFAGMLDLGFVVFYAIGAYTMAILTSPELGFFSLTFWEALPFSMLFATLGGAILALPILKMRGDYLAIATLGFGEIIRILALSDFLKPSMGGAQGITLIARPEIGPLVIKDPQQFYYIVLIGCLIAWYVGSSLKNSRMGRAWIAIREDEDVAQAMGINRVMVKLSAFVIGAFLGGMSGGIFAAFVGSVVPKSFELLISINVLALIIVGGMGSLPGIVVGALVMVGLPELLREFREYRMLVYGAVVMVMMLYRPQGLWPEAVVAREFEEQDVEIAVSDDDGAHESDTTAANSGQEKTTDEHR